MKLSAPIFILKQQAKALARKAKIPLHQALDRIANREGFGAWSLLSSSTISDRSIARLLAHLVPGDLVLLAARPRQGKTLLSLGLAVECMKRGRRAAFFTLEFTRAEIAECFAVLEENLESFSDRLLINDSDQISAAFIVSELAAAPAGMLVVIDYLQLLDQKRSSPDLLEQVRELKTFARARGLIVVCLSQIDRNYDAEDRLCPDLRDVRLPNPVDLTLFDRACFLHRGEMRVSTT